jgi:carboxylesterase
MADLGVLLLHGFTTTFAPVEPLVAPLHAAGIPWRMPVLRGHGKTPEALFGVTAADWLTDAELALNDLLGQASRAVVVGFSLGGAIALELGLRRPKVLSGIVALAPALRWTSPLAALAPLLGAVVKRFPAPKPPPDLGYRYSEYTWFPTESFVAAYRFGQAVENRLPQLRTPLLVVGSNRDRVIQPRSSHLAHDNAGSSRKRLIMLDDSDHEVLMGNARLDALAAIMRFVTGEPTVS